jgi:hypothetical protein
VIKLAKNIYTTLPKELQAKYPSDTIVRVIKPLYGIAEAGVHWWATYHAHHLNELQMVISTYDPCLLVTIGPIFGLIGMQTDDILHLCSPEFSAIKEKKNQKAGFRSKPKISLSKSSFLEFNEGRITLLDDHLSLR